MIHELPTPRQRLVACAGATVGIGKLLGLDPKRSIPFGAPVHVAFGMTGPDAKRRERAALLLTHGADVALSYCG